MSFNGFFYRLISNNAKKTDALTLNKPKASPADLSKQVHPLCIIAK